MFCYNLHYKYIIIDGIKESALSGNRDDALEFIKGVKFETYWTALGSEDVNARMTHGRRGHAGVTQGRRGHAGETHGRRGHAGETHRRRGHAGVHAASSRVTRNR